MVQSVIFYTSHQLHVLLTGPQFVLTQARKTGYEVIVSAPQPTIQCCNTINPATRMMTLVTKLHMTVSRKHLRHFLDAMHFPDAIAIIKCSAHQKTDTLIGKTKSVSK